MYFQCILFFTALLLVKSENHGDEFHEELLVKPLSSGHVYSYFQFTTLWKKPQKENTFDHCHLFPRPLGELLDKFNIQELHISLTGGLWRHEAWGYPVLDAPPGAELWVWFKAGTDNVDKKWKELNGALSGLLCASLNFIDTSNSMSPEMSFRPSGVEDADHPLNSTMLRYGTLPREIVCTENLTPWKKLLPCDSKRGLATLLNAGYIHNTNYHSLGLHYRPVCVNKECTETGLELKQTVSLVYDLVILGGSSSDWSIRKLFGLGLAGPCPLSSSSTVYLDITSNSTGQTFRLNPLPDHTEVSTRGGHQAELAVYDISKLDLDTMFNIALVHDKPRVFTQNIPPAVYANRYIVGYGQEHGGIVTKVHNRHWQPITIVFLENIPWFVPVYFHTLNIVSQGKTIKPLLKRYVPGRERQRPYYLEVLVELPARSVTDISVQFDYMFLKWQEYPPDANHGFYIGSAVLTAWLPVARNYTGLPQDGSLISSSINASREGGYMVRLRTESLIITLPTPDFSMPYNVICLACTVVALAFGPLHNITTKKLQLTKAGEPRGIFAVFANRSTKFFVTLGILAIAAIFTLRHLNVIAF